MGLTHDLAVRVYWEDTDAGGIVYHASYLRFMERGRTELLRAAGIDQGALLANEGITFVVTKMNIAFKSSAKLDDMLAIQTAIVRIGGASLTLSQKVMRGGDVIVEAEIICAALSPAKGRPARMPAAVKAKLTV